MRVRTLLFVVLLLLGGILIVQAQSSKRLVLKDGSYQVVTKWEVTGDRVRYYSAERGQWEELPSSMVDWKATEDYEKNAASEKNTELENALKEDAEDAAKENASSPEVAPGIRLPDGGGVYLLENFKNQPQLDELVQTNSEINKNTGKNILRATINPIASAKQSIELKGAHARVQAHSGTPEIYIDIDSDTQTEKLQLADHFRIARLTEKKDMRLLGNLKVSMIGKVSQEGSFVKTSAEKMAGDWVRLKPLEPLAPGEYAVVEMLTPKEMNLYVWDFGVNPEAPENATAWKPAPPKENKMGTDESPVLLTPHKN
ncbi:MAG TPA: hypothetical protein VFU86_07785 [Terriglobales bacterium]|nr:hypothetical protein [Terriglobales bacterium]